MIRAAASWTFLSASTSNWKFYAYKAVTALSRDRQRLFFCEKLTRRLDYFDIVHFPAMLTDADAHCRLDHGRASRVG